MLKHILFILIFVFCVFEGNAQTFDNLYSHGVDSASLRPDLIEQTSDLGYIGIGDGILMKIDEYGDISWAKEIPSINPSSLKLDPDDHIYYTFQENDLNGFTHSRIMKTNPEGYQIWSINAGNGFEEVLYNDIYVESSDYFYAVGQMKTDSVWHNIVTKFNYLGNEEWSRRFFQWHGPGSNQVPDNSKLIKIDQGSNGILYILGQINNKVLLYRMSSYGGLSSLKKFGYKDSLIPIDIVAQAGSDVQILMKFYL